MGNLSENLVVCEALKARVNAGLLPDLWFMRTSNVVEAGLVVENGLRLDLFEVKSSASDHPDMGAPLSKLARLLPDIGHRGVIYAGHDASCADGTSVLSFETAAPCFLPAD